MGESQSDIEAVGTEDEPAPPELNPLRAAGWFFRDGDCIAIERQSEEARTQELAD